MELQELVKTSAHILSEKLRFNLNVVVEARYHWNIWQDGASVPAGSNHNHVQLWSKSEDTLLVCVCVCFQTCGSTSHVNDLPEQQKDGCFLLLSVAGSNRRPCLLPGRSPLCVVDELVSRLWPAGLVFHRARSNVVSAAKEQWASWAVRRYLLMYVRTRNNVSEIMYDSNLMEM